MEWTQDHVLELINLLYGKPELWDQKANRNKQLQMAALNDIAMNSGRDVREVEKKLNYLRSQFSREWLRVKRAITNNEEYEPKWFAYKPLSFLIYKRHVNKPIQDKDREELFEQSMYFTPYERKLLEAIENPPGENNNEIEANTMETNLTANETQQIIKPTEIKARRRSTRKSVSRVKEEFYNEDKFFELLENQAQDQISSSTPTPNTSATTNTTNINEAAAAPNTINTNTPKNHLANPVEHAMKKMRIDKNTRKQARPVGLRHRNYDLINAKLKFVALQKKFLMQEQKKKEEINRLQLEHEKYKLEITKLEVEKKRLDVQIRNKMVD